MTSQKTNTYKQRKAPMNEVPIHHIKKIQANITFRKKCNRWNEMKNANDDCEVKNIDTDFVYDLNFHKTK